MKKAFSIVIALFILAAGSLAGITFWFGMEAEQRYHDALRQASQLKFVNLTNEGYSRGFLRSKARTGVKIRHLGIDLDTGPIESGEELLAFTLVDDIRHGPLPLGKLFDGKRRIKPVLAIIETTIELSPETQARLKKIFGELPEAASIRSYTTLSLAGDGETQLVIPALHQTVGEDKRVALNWKGLTANMAFTADLKGFTGTLRAPGLEAVSDKGELKMRGLESTLDMHKGISGLFLGDASFQVALLEFAENKDGVEKRFSVNGLKMKTSSHALTDTINYSMAMQLDQVMTDNTPYGPGSYELELRKLDAASLAKLQQTLQELQDQFPQRPAQDINQMMLAKYLEILPGLMKKSPEIEITHLRFKTTDGDFLGKAKIVFDGTNIAALNNPFLLLSGVTAHAEFSITDRLLQRILASSYEKEIIATVKQGKRAALSKEEIRALAVTKSAKRLETLMEQNILVHQDGKYKASAEYQLGQVILNGRPLTLQDLLQQS